MKELPNQYDLARILNMSVAGKSVEEISKVTEVQPETVKRFIEADKTSKKVDKKEAGK
jgi:hypothetical protein